MYQVQGISRYHIISVNETNLSDENKEFLISIIIRNPAYSSDAQHHKNNCGVEVRLTNINITRELLTVLENY